ncbi:hypothetical protein [Stenoxybacter acetivorans]|uniref:hypothetical protein n=1 Tax=Stenoxybacter acetivorans TaxID=422441 RepID=UPI000564CBDC|nr:hypothetical protein [Stenoxybacter acetivorans]
MSAFYLMAVAFIWFKLTQWTGKLWLKWRKNKPNTSRLLIDLSFMLIFLAWFTASFWYGGGRVHYYNAEVKRLCAIDGGIKVYEKVVLSPEDYDKLMKIGLGSSPSDKYFLAYQLGGKSLDTIIRNGNPTIKRDRNVVMERDNKKIIAEIIRYYRFDGGFPGPWETHGFSCPNYIDFSLERSIFTKEAVK